MKTKSIVKREKLLFLCKSCDMVYRIAVMDKSIIVKDGWVYIGFFLILTAAGLVIQHGYYLSVPSAGVLLFVTWFFRNPERNTPAGDAVIAPADGTVIKIEKNNKYAQFMGNDAVCVSIFMSVFNVHVNRFPVNGVVVDKHYHPGKFHVASVDKASEFNEQTVLFLRDDTGKKLVVVQIAGSVARRIVCKVEQGTKMTAGSRYGMIKLGSRLDVYIEPDRLIKVKIGDTTRAGETILAV